MAKNSTPTSFVKILEKWFHFLKKIAGTSIGLVLGPGFPGLHFIRWTSLCFKAASIKMQDLKTVILGKSGNKEEYRDRTEKVLTRLSPGQMM